MIWKLLFAVFLNFILIMWLPYLLAENGYLFEIKDKSWIILFVTAATISLKAILGDMVSGSFDYHKHGYDFCLTAMGASMSALSLQIISPTNLFPSLSVFPTTKLLSNITSDPINITLIYLVLILILSSLLTFLTARISKAINHEKPQCPDLLSILNFFLGTGVLSTYVLILITKG